MNYLIVPLIVIFPDQFGASGVVNTQCNIAPPEVGV